MENTEKITIQEIAELAGVSIATVSRVLNHKANVSVKTREKVMQAMNSAGFQPASLSRPDSGSILMCVSNLSNPFNVSVINGAQRIANQQGYRLLLIQTHSGFHSIESFESMAREHQFLGIIFLVPSKNLSLLEEINRRCPLVMCSEYLLHPEISYVSIDDCLAAKTAVHYLHSIGYHKIALLNGSLEKKYSQNRECGFREAMAEAGYPVHEEWIKHIHSINYALAYNCACSLLNQPDRPNALFAISDVFAAAAIHAAQKLGLRVPEDLPVIGFDNTDISIMTSPTITTVQQPADAIGAQSCEILLEKIRNPKAEVRHVFLNTDLILRESTIGLR